MKNLQVIKQSNQALVLNYVRMHEPVSRRHISRELSLSPTTASSAVGHLIDMGLMHEVGHGVSTGGRRPIMVEINAKGGTVISVDMSSGLQGRIIRAAALDLKSNILTEIKHERIIDSNETMLAAITGIINELISSPDVKLRDAMAIGVSVPGLVNSETGELIYTNINVHNLALGPCLAEEFQAPVLVHNSEDAAAFGEYSFGAGHGSKSLVFLTIGSGVGSGLVSEGKIYQHGRTSSGEIGHMTILPDGPLCSCGNSGCLTTLVATETLVQKVRDAIDAGQLAETAGLSRADLDLHKILTLAQEGQPFCKQLISQAADWIGIAVSSMINMLNPEVIVFGGELFEGSSAFLPLVQNVVERRAIKSYLPSVRLVRSNLDRRAGLQGVAMLALNKLLEAQTT